jgi:hypothetical protein
MSTKSNLHQVPEYHVVGAGLSGLLVAAQLLDAGHSVTVLDGSDTTGGHNKPIPTAWGAHSNGLRLLPHTESARRGLEFLGRVLGQEITFDVVEANPLTFESAEFRPFVGFGSHPPDFFEEINYFNCHEYIVLHEPTFTWSQRLSDKVMPSFQPRSFVTRVHAEGNRAAKCMINGAKQVDVQNMVYCGSLPQLKTILPESALSARLRQRLAKGPYWTALGLDLVHPATISESRAVHILSGSSQEELVVCAGLFHPPTAIENATDESGPAPASPQLSQWMTYVDHENAADDELVANQLKKVKRQIKRAYPHALDNLLSERIVVFPDISGSGDLKLNANQTLPSLRNFWIGSPQVNPHHNLIGVLMQSELVVKSLLQGPEAYYQASELIPSPELVRDIEPE